MHDTVSLAGEWRIALDRQNEGIRARWYARTLTESIALPGTTDEAHMGDLTGECCTDRLSRVWRWIGPAWYQRTVTIPKRWKGQRITLFLERTKDSQVWVDDQWMGSDDSLSTPHVFDLSAQLTPGRHTLTILVDNAKLPPVGPCHQVDERTQTNWNGIVGRIELQATDPVWLGDIQIHPRREWIAVPNTEETECRRWLRIAGAVGNAAQVAGDAAVTVAVEVVGAARGPALPPGRFTVPLRGADTPFSLDMPVPADLPAWDEFDTRMLRVTVSLAVGTGRNRLQDVRTVDYGMRTFNTARGQFVVNGRPTFLRGKNDCALFPITGYAPMDKAYWLRHLGIAKSYGINHYRFHSWCPPEAAFAAADELGIYFQAELPNKRGLTQPENRHYTPPSKAYETLDELKGDAGDPAVRTAYLAREGERILRAYGNHPSFVMMTLGNEIGGDESVMEAMCDRFRALDNRRLYAMGTNHWHWELRPRKGDDFWVIKGTGPDNAIRGASWESCGHIDHRPPSTTVDYAAQLRGVPMPVVGHETAQFEVFPDFREARKYTGVLKARFFDVFRERLAAAGMLDQALDFVKASGALSAICHREDVEAALRTPGFGGFQMLDLQDFSGQGVALVGLLDVFMASKGLITPAEWRESCCETVPLLWMTKYTWTNSETFRGRIRVAHYGPADLKHQTVAWEVGRCQSAEGGRRKSEVLACGESRAVDIPTGTVTEVDVFSLPLGSVGAATKLTITLTVKGTTYRNRYDIWVYPAKVKSVATRGVVVARSFDRNVESALAAGKRVLLLAEPGTLKQTVTMAFQTGFWSPMFRNKPGRLNPMGTETPGTQGILCDPSHPLFRGFPTESHSNWQWWQLVKNSRAMILDAMPKGFRPIVQVIDGFDRNHRLGLIFEVRVGKGRLLVCSIDLPTLQAHPEARQLLASTMAYVKSSSFAPTTELDATTRKGLSDE